MSFDQEMKNLYKWIYEEMAKHPHANGKLYVPKSHIKRGEMMVTKSMDLTEYQWLIDMYGLTHEELMIWTMWNEQEFQYAYWECGLIPKVTMAINNGGWCEHVIRARITFEKSKKI
jgi:hypothetical protein